MLHSELEKCSVLAGGFLDLKVVLWAFTTQYDLPRTILKLRYGSTLLENDRNYSIHYYLNWKRRELEALFDIMMNRDVLLMSVMLSRLLNTIFCPSYDPVLTS